MPFPGVFSARANVEIAWHLVEEELAASKRPNVTLDLAVRDYSQARLLQQVHQFMANREMGNGSATDVQPDAEIFPHSVAIEPALMRDTDNDSPVHQLGKLSVGMLNLPPHLGRHCVQQRTGECERHVRGCEAADSLQPAGLLREVHAAEEGLETGVVTQP